MQLLNQRSASRTTALSQGRQSVVLLVTMVMIVLLSLSGYYFSDLSITEYKAANYRYRQAAARAIAESGIHYAMAILSDTCDPTTNLPTELNGNWPYHYPALFESQPVTPTDDKSFSGKFTLLAPPDPGQTPGGTPHANWRFGVTDETGKLNLTAFMQIDSTGQMVQSIMTNIGQVGNFQNLPSNLTSVADCILDWMDPDDTVRSDTGQGAESDAYSGFNYVCKNAPLDSLEELLLVQGITPQFLFGDDSQRTGFVDGSTIDPGWSRFFTIYSREQLVNPQTNQPLIYLNETNLQNLQTNLSANNLIDPDLAAYILAYRLYGPWTNPSASSKGGKSSPSSTGLPEGYTAGEVSELVGKLDITGTTTAKTQINSIFDLVNTQVLLPPPPKPKTPAPTAPTAPGSPKAPGAPAKKTEDLGTVYTCPLNDENKAQAGTLMTALFLNATTWPSSTTSSSSSKSAKTGSGSSGSSGGASTTERPARININTATPELVTALLLAVLQPSPGQTGGTGGTPAKTSTPPVDIPTITTSILQNPGRPALDSTDPPDTVYQTPVWLYTQANIDAKTLSKLDPYITTVSQVFRVQSEGELDVAGPTARVEAVIDINCGRPRIVYWRDLTELGKSSHVKINDK